MADVSLLEPIQGLLDDADLMGRMVETARLYWTNSFLTVNIFSTLFNGTILIMACLLFIYVFDLLSNSSLGQLMLQKKSYDVAAEEATYALGAILELQEQVRRNNKSTLPIPPVPLSNQIGDCGCLSNEITPTMLVMILIFW